jgi:signal recognition particle subunit SRP54
MHKMSKMPGMGMGAPGGKGGSVGKRGKKMGGIARRRAKRKR